MKFSMASCERLQILCTILILNNINILSQEPLAPTPHNAHVVSTETSLGDLIDKILVLTIKQERIQNQEKQSNIRKELQLLLEVFQANVQPSEELDELSNRLLQINMNLWELEDAARLKERAKCFDKEFLDIVVAILNNNDERACIKRTINLLGKSHIIEEKSYTDIIETAIEACNETAHKQLISLLIPVAIGDLADRITILLIKREHIQNKGKHDHIFTEYTILHETLKQVVTPSAEFEKLFNDLFNANQQLWDIQDQLRAKKQANTFDDEFINLARSVYYVNDRRCAIKKEINMLFGSKLIEEKCYTNY
jgi:hypothetical protein